jgi:predicted membrane protein
MLWSALAPKQDQDGPPATEISRLNAFTAFGGTKIVNTSRDFRGGDIFAVFGGHEIDLRQSEMAGDSVTISATSIFGGVEIWVPETWVVTISGLPIFGGFEDKTAHRKETDTAGAKQLLVRGLAIFGGVEIKN